MAAILVTEQSFTVGDPTVIEGRAPNTNYAAVFEDDGRTGYFYGLDFSLIEQPIVDARHIYNVEQVADRSVPSTVQIAWSPDGLKTVLFVNKYPHAVIDFDARRSYCRTGFPPPSEKWSAHDAAWDDKAAELFR
jgi:hypothetical protein